MGWAHAVRSMLSGMTDLHRELERRVAKFLGPQDAMLLTADLAARWARSPGCFAKPTWRFSTNRSHLSLRDGACFPDAARRNSSTTIQSRSIQALSRQKGRRALVIVEGIYSMDGDFGNLKELTDVAQIRMARSVFIDEAH